MFEIILFCFVQLEGGRDGGGKRMDKEDGTRGEGNLHVDRWVTALLMVSCLTWSVGWWKIKRDNGTQGMINKGRGKKGRKKEGRRGGV